MKKILLLVCFASFALISVNAQWNPVGQPGITHNSVYQSSLAIDNTGVPYVAFPDYSGSQATVKKFDGAHWIAVGDTDFSAGYTQYESLAFDNSNTPHVIFQDWANNNKATVMKFNGTSWITVGQAGFSDSAVTFTSIAFDNSGTLYAAYMHESGGTIAIKKYTGSSWVNVGSLLPASYYISNIAVDGSGTPYIAFTDQNGWGYLQKFNGSSWVNLAPFLDPGFIAPSLAIDGTGIPYVGFEDVRGGVTVVKCQTSQWDTVGYPNFSYSLYSGAKYVSLAIDPSNTPYVAFQDGSVIAGAQGKAAVAKFTGSGWTQVGGADISLAQATYISLALDASGAPYVSYSDYFYNQKLTVMKFGPVSTEVNEVSDTKEIRVLPNPTTGTIQVSFQGITEGKMRLEDISGKLISTNSVHGESQSVDISGLSNGIYILTIQSDQGTFSQKIVKQ